MLTNYHTHTCFCDGKNTPEEIVKSAIDKGFKSIGFSGHGYTPYDLSYCMKDIDGYINEISRLKEKYDTKINVYCGVEEDAFSYVERERFDYIIGSSGTNTGIEEIKNGMVIGRYSDDRMYYEERTEIAFSLDVGEASEVIKLYTVSEEAYEILYRIAKNNAHFDECYDEIVEVYIQNEIGKILYNFSSKLCESAVRSSLLESLDRAGIAMN